MEVRIFRIVLLPYTLNWLCQGEPIDQEKSSEGRRLDDWIKLNVGGQHFLTTRATLCSTEPDSMLARMFGLDCVSDVSWSSKQDVDGAYLIDRSPKYFDPILNYLRHGNLIVDSGINLEGVLEEAKFFGLAYLVRDIEQRTDLIKPPSDDAPLTRREVIDIIARCHINPKKSVELRFQGLNFSGTDLSMLDLSHVNFKFANLTGTNLSGCTLSFSNFTRANLSNANLDGAELVGARFPGATLEHASLKVCNFEGPTGARVNLEGANLKCAVLEGSQMYGVNLRVSTLKNANLKNCTLRYAVLAGADLENCDFSGSDLFEANMRGANFVGATFDSMVTPLHMSQSLI